jgi:hypothetical protein
MTTTDRNNKTKMKNFSNTMLECLIWQQIWRSLKVGFRREGKGTGEQLIFHLCECAQTNDQRVKINE